MLNRYFILSVIILLFCLQACAHFKEVGDNTQYIKVTRSESSDSWAVEYPKLNGDYAFDRNINRFRSQIFKPLSRGTKVVNKDQYERIEVSFDGVAPKFEFDSYYEYTPKDYEFFQSMVDESVLMYTGHLPLCKLETDACKTPKICYEFKGRAQDNIVILGEVFGNTAKWCDDEKSGTYVYFGSHKPVSSEQLTLLFDPALPQWIREKSAMELVEIFDFYAIKTGISLSFKPYILASYRNQGKHLNSGGGSLPGMLQLSFEGEPWKIENGESKSKWGRFLSHEAAHFWNSRMYKYHSKMSWMHEGGADAFAFRRMYESGKWSQRDLDNAENNSLGLCLDRLKGRSLVQVKENADKKEQYYCGSTAMLIAELAIQKKNPKLSLFDLWKTLFADTKESKVYSEEQFFKTLDKMTGEQETSQFLRDFLYSPKGMSAAKIESKLKSLGSRI